jgi:type II secretory pathway component GspD/PulD (secretin)
VYGSEASVVKTSLWQTILLLVLLLISVALCATASPALANPASGDEAAEGEGTEQESEGDEEEGKAEAPEPDITVYPSGVTVHAVNVHAHRFFTRLAEKTDLQLIVDDAIKDRKVTVHLADMSPEEVISYVVSAYGFSCKCVDGIHMISEGIPRKPSSYLLSDIKSIPTQYVQANNAKGLLPVFLQDHVKVNYGQNAVVLSAPTDVLEKFEEDIRQFDTPAAQIMLEILVVEFTDWYSAERNLAIRWHNAGRGAEWGTLDLAPADSALPARTMGELILRGVADLPTEFRVRLEALVASRQANVRAAPRIATVSGRYASFFVGTQRYLRQPVEVQEYMTQNFIDAGVRLVVRPWTGDGKEIICSITPEVSTLTALDPVTGLPDKITRTADTMVRVRNGQTIVIGGLREEEQRKIRTKVPVLGDIPIIGNLFRSSSELTIHTDLVIFITPRVILNEGQPLGDEDQELGERFLEDS